MSASSSSYGVKAAMCLSFLLLLAALALVPSAEGGTWGWEGTVGIGAGNGECPRYSGQAACSPWNYWYQNNGANLEGDLVLVGYETTTVGPRGHYVNAGEETIVYPSELGMGGWYTRGTTTYCTWHPSCTGPTGGAHIWFRVWA